MKRNTPPQISLLAFVRLMLHRWPLFLCSIIFFLGVIFVLGKRTVIGNSEYKVGLMVRFSEASEDKILTEKNQPLLLWRMKPAYTPSQIYGWLVSADIIYRSGLKEGFDVEYSQKNFWGRFDVYNNMPIRLFFLDAKDMDTFSLDLLLSEGKAKLSNFRGTFRGQEINIAHECTIEGVGQIADTPFGRVLMADNPGSDEYDRTPLNLAQTINVHRLRGIDIRAKYDWDMNLSLHHGTVFTLKIKTSGSQRRSYQVLSAMLEECNEVVRRHIMEDLTKEHQLLQASIDSIASPFTTSLSPEVKREQKKIFEEYLAQNIANQGIAMYERMIEVTDPPMIQPAPPGNFYVKLILLLLAIVIPIGIIYLIWSYRNTILEKTQLSKFWKKTMPLSFTSKGGVCTDSTIDTLLYRINEDFKLKTSSLEEYRLPNKSIILTTPTPTKEANYWIEKIVEAFQSTERTVRVIELQNSDSTKTYPNSHTIMLRTGYLMSDAFVQDVSLLAEEKAKEVISLFIVPSDKVALLQKEASTTIVLLIAEKTKMEDLCALEEEIVNTSSSLNSIHTMWIEKRLYF
ncbi:hypothetical protein HQ36_03440 [Porphyromonas gingivicanis]|uniref:Uncharacterized protein n=2 Tax=Porphyromonas gingivicanis TaxID=266762 RepID=A0A0A2G437_9PORP|nr:hypothetical protein HQ36_03440 [Porphyromonas gingivicanis]